MKTDLRKSGIEIVGDVPWGTHFCQFYQSKEDLIEILVPYFEAGLENNEFCMWVTAEPLNVEDAKSALKAKVKNLDDYIKKGQIEILDYSQWYTKTGKFEADKVLAGWVEKEKQAIERGFDGLRLTGNTFWLEKKDWENFASYEAIVNSIIRKHRMLAVCSYSLDKCQAGEVIEVVDNHQFAFIRKEGKWILLQSSDRKQAEQDLRETQNYLENLINYANAPIIVWTPDFKITKFNHAFEHLTGRSAEEVLGKELSILFPEENYEQVLLEIKRTLSGNNWESVEIPILNKDGSTRVVLWNSANIYAENGTTLTATIAQGVDITERKQAEEKIKIFSNAVQNAYDSFILTDINGNVTNTNESSIKAFGYSHEEILKLKVSQLTADPKDANNIVEEVKNKGKWSGETISIRKNKEKFPALLTVSIVKDDKDNPTGMMGIFRDITERKKAQEKIKIFSDAIASAFDCLILSNEEGNITYANESAIRTFGYTPEEFLKLNIADLDADPKVAKKVMQEMLTKEKWSGEVTNIRKNKEKFSSLLSAFIIKDDKGNPKGAMGILRDITERKQMEENLRLSKTQAEAANEAKSRFLANMSHEIRTPLNSIIGFSEILMQEELAEEHKEHLRIVYNSGKHLLRLIGDILDFSRIEAGKMNIEMEQCSLGQLIAKIESMMRPFAAEKGLTFEIREKGDLPANIVTDAAHLQQCLTNLVNNAIKFTEQGHIYVNISLEDKDSKPCIRFEVEDTGTGIAPESQQKIFEPFVQEDGSTSRKYGGTGLGLTITKKLAELLGGELTLTSEKGKGSVFSLVIPAGVDLATQPLLERQKISDDTSTDMSEAKHARFSGCVLVAEDVKSNQMFMKALLERMGLKITIAENGAEAVDKALGQKFDLIFMDIQMPQVNGYEAARTLRSKGIKTPIVALTAGAMEGDDKKCIEAGCDDYLSKPIVHSKLTEALSKYLENDALPKDGDFTVKSDNDKVNENYLSQMDAPDNEEVIDWAQMVAHGLDEQSMKEIIPTYVNDNKEHLRGLISAVKTSNAKDVQSHAHAIKGAGRNLGVARLSELAGQLETMALKEDLSEAEELLKDITSEFHRLEEFISRPDWIETAKEQARITGLTNLAEFFY